MDALRVLCHEPNNVQQTNKNKKKQKNRKKYIPGCVHILYPAHFKLPRRNKRVEYYWWKKSAFVQVYPLLVALEVFVAFRVFLNLLARLVSLLRVLVQEAQIVV